MTLPSHPPASPPSRWLLLAGDIAALLLFVYVGQRDHEVVNAANPLLGVVTAAAVFVAPWIAAGALLGAFPRAEAWRPWPLLARSLNTWLLAAPLGVALRALVLGRAVIPTAFLLAALGFGGLFVLGWRALLALAWTWRQRRASAA